MKNRQKIKDVFFFLIILIYATWLLGFPFLICWIYIFGYIKTAILLSILKIIHYIYLSIELKEEL